METHVGYHLAIIRRLENEVGMPIGQYLQGPAFPDLDTKKLVAVTRALYNFGTCVDGAYTILRRRLIPGARPASGLSSSSSSI